MEPDPAIDSQAKHSNVHLPWGTDNLMDRLEEIAASKDFKAPTSEP